ncbi:hypothetical protein ACFPRL_19510 [Pseudoclavibacter helvolus]
MPTSHSMGAARSPPSRALRCRWSHESSVVTRGAFQWSTAWVGDA